MGRWGLSSYNTRYYNLMVKGVGGIDYNVTGNISGDIMSNIKITFDIGAHKGEFLKSIKQLKKFNKIYAFEPQKKIYNKLQLLNEDNKIICLNLAISDNSGIKNLKINKLL